MGDFWATTLSAIRTGNPDWAAIATYEAPIRRFLARRFPKLPGAERDDLTQDVLLAMREKIVPGYDVEVGPFRAFLTTSITNAVRMHVRRQRPLSGLDEAAQVADPTPAEVEALDLEARIVRAIRAVHDRHASGPQADLQLIYVLSGVLVARLSSAAIAKREGLSADQVKRTLQRARAEILQEVFAGLSPQATPAELSHMSELARACLRSPRKERRLLDADSKGELVGRLTRAVREARSVLGSNSADSVDLLHGIEAIFC